MKKKVCFLKIQFCVSMLWLKVEEWAKDSNSKNIKFKRAAKVTNYFVTSTVSDMQIKI